MTRKMVNALHTPQWRDGWEKIVWDQDVSNGKPAKYFLTFVMKASELRQLSGVFRRNPNQDGSRASDANIQRPHESARSREIRRFVELGYPMSSMTPSQLAAAEPELQRPGWLPTAVVINVLREGESREGLEPLSSDQAIEISVDADAIGGSIVKLGIPENPAAAAARETPPFEVIDGQHRLWGFEDDSDTEDYFLPVVAFVDLSKAYQAYLFWSINIKPKKINTSLAFDLYPILRSQEWLMKGEGLKVYRESRAQELTEALWAYPLSPWYDRINMIGATGVADRQPVTQASFVRSLLASFIKPWNGRGDASGGLFGTDEAGGLDWNRSQQAAYLVAAWQEIFAAISDGEASWFEPLRAAASEGGSEPDPIGRFSMLGSDQGVRVVFLVLNELSYRLRDELGLRDWQMPPAGDAVDPAQVSDALDALDSTGFRSFLRSVAKPLAQFDWRTIKAPGISRDEERLRAVYRGSGGYVALRRDIYEILASSLDDKVSSQAAIILAELRAADDAE